MATFSALDEDEDPWDAFEPTEINYYMGSAGTGPEPPASAPFGTATFPYHCPPPDATQSAESMFAPPTSETTFCATTANWPSQPSDPIPPTINPNYLNTVQQQPDGSFDALPSTTSSSREQAASTHSRPTKPFRKTDSVSRKRQKLTSGSISSGRLQDVCPNCQSACAGGCELRRQAWSLPLTSNSTVEPPYTLPFSSDRNKTSQSSFLSERAQQEFYTDLTERTSVSSGPNPLCTQNQSTTMSIQRKPGNTNIVETCRENTNGNIASSRRWFPSFACVFQAHDPQRYCATDERYRTCQKGYKSFNHLLYHCHRIHMAPIRCQRCQSQFSFEKDLKSHLRRQEGCSLKREGQVDSMTKEHLEEILTSVKDVREEGEKWKIMYEILFTGCSAPFPFVFSDSLDHYTADILENYRMNELPRLLARMQFGQLEFSEPPLRVILCDFVKKYAAMLRTWRSELIGVQTKTFNQTAIFTTPQNFRKDVRDLSRAADTSKFASRDFTLSAGGFGNSSPDLQFHQNNREYKEIASSFVGPAFAQLENSIRPNPMVNYTNGSSWESGQGIRGQPNNTGSANLNFKLENNTRVGRQPKGSTGEVLFSEPIPYDQEPRLESQDSPLRSNLGSDMDRRWACPYHKFDRPKYCINKKTGCWYKSCPGGFSCFRFLKEHLYGSGRRGRHTASPHVCMKCLTTFCSDSSLNSHLQAQECIQSNEPLGSIGITPAHRAQFEHEVKEAKSDKERWHILYRILFPGRPVPSPYVESNEVQSEVELHMASFQAFQTASLPQLLGETLAAEFALLPVAEKKRRIEAILNCVTQTYINWNARGNSPHENLTMATQSAENFETRGGSLSRSLASDNRTWSNCPDAMEDIVPQVLHNPSSQRVDAHSQTTATFDSSARLSGCSAFQQNYHSGGAVQQETVGSGNMWQSNYDRSRTGVESVPDASSSGHVLGDTIGFDPDAVSEDFGWAQMYTTTEEETLSRLEP